jgi:hypothetical protein
VVSSRPWVRLVPPAGSPLPSRSGYIGVSTSLGSGPRLASQASYDIIRTVNAPPGCSTLVRLSASSTHLLCKEHLAARHLSTVACSLFSAFNRAFYAGHVLKVEGSLSPKSVHQF